MTAVVILPGLDGTSALLAEFCESLSALGVAARAVAYPPDRPLGYEQLEALVRAQLPCEPHVLLGESFSGGRVPFSGRRAMPGDPDSHPSRQVTGTVFLTASGWTPHRDSSGIPPAG
jgi:hypothetical protein